MFFKKAYGKDNLKKMSFDYFKNSNFINILEILFYITLIPIILVTIISNCYEIENISFYNNFLKNEKLEELIILKNISFKYIKKKIKSKNKNNFKTNIINKKKLLISRLIISFIMLFFCFFINDEYYLIIFSGITIVPFIGFIFPVF